MEAVLWGETWLFNCLLQGNVPGIIPVSSNTGLTHKARGRRQWRKTVVQTNNATIPK
jgi:hypothetical protein